MSPAFVVLNITTTLILVIIVAVQSHDFGKKKGREAERNQVVAFLMTRLNDYNLYPPEVLAKMIHEGAHEPYDLK